MARSAELASASSQAFALTLQQTSYDQANTYLGDLGKEIADAQSLSAKYPRLIALRKNTGIGSDKLMK